MQTNAGRERHYDLEQRTTEYGKAVVRFVNQCPVVPANDRILRQVVGSAGSIGANYREANDALGKKDFLYRLKIARKEAKETIHWLDMLAEVEHKCQHNTLDTLRQEATEIRNILSAIIQKIEQ